MNQPVYRLLFTVYYPMKHWLGLIPALLIIGVLFGASLIYGVAQSLGWLPFIEQREISLDAYRRVISDPAIAPAFWAGLRFSLWISLSSTVLSALITLCIVSLLDVRSTTSQRRFLRGLNFNLALPHMVWAIGFLLIASQSGLIARLAHALGLIDAPADFPVIVRDRWGVGIIATYIAKEVPFLLLIVLGVIRSQAQSYDLVAENLGANRWQRLRMVTMPLIAPSLLAGSLLVFAFIFGAYEVPALLGVRFPEMLSVVALDFFLNPDLRARAEGMAISVMMTVVVLLIVVGVLRVRRRTSA